MPQEFWQLRGARRPVRLPRGARKWWGYRNGREWRVAHYLFEGPAILPIG